MIFESFKPRGKSSLKLTWILKVMPHPENSPQHVSFVFLLKLVLVFSFLLSMILYSDGKSGQIVWAEDLANVGYLVLNPCMFFQFSSSYGVCLEGFKYLNGLRAVTGVGFKDSNCEFPCHEKKKKMIKPPRLWSSGKSEFVMNGLEARHKF